MGPDQVGTRASAQGPGQHLTLNITSDTPVVRRLPADGVFLSPAPASNVAIGVHFLHCLPTALQPS